MVSTGVKPSEEQIKLFTELQHDKKHRAIVFRLNDKGNAIEHEETYQREAQLSEISSKLPTNDCRFVILDFEYENYDKPPKPCNKVLLMYWLPDGSPMKRNVAYAGARGELQSEFKGIANVIQATDKSYWDYETIRKELC